MPFKIFRQKITAGAGNDWIGDDPGTTPTSGNDIAKDYPTAALHGGLFDFEQENPIRVDQVQLKLGTQTSWSLSILNEDASEIPVFVGTTETSFLSSSYDAFYLITGQKLKLVSAGGDGGFEATIFTSS